jgi:hypothetical protein
VNFVWIRGPQINPNYSICLSFLILNGKTNGVPYPTARGARTVCFQQQGTTITTDISRQTTQRTNNMTITTNHNSQNHSHNLQPPATTTTTTTLYQLLPKGQKHVLPPQAELPTTRQGCPSLLQGVAERSECGEFISDH